jgi:putative intracellular protease/amidase
MTDELKGKRVAAVVDDGFEQVELTEPKAALEAAGARVDVISPRSGKVRAGSILTGARESSSTAVGKRPTRTSTTRCCYPAA